MLLLLGVGSLVCAHGLTAQERLVRTFDQDRGLAGAPVWALDQDAVGFLWIGAQGGLFRYDGSEIRQWTRDRISDAVADIVVSPGGTVVVRTLSGDLWEVTEDDVVRLDTPGPSRLTGPRAIEFDHAGRLWMIHGDTLSWRAPAGEWKSLGPERFGQEAPYRVRRSPRGGVVVAAGHAVWRVDPGTAPEPVYRGGHVLDLAWDADGSLLVLEHVPGEIGGQVVEVDARGSRLRAPLGLLPRTRAIALVERRGTVWVALDRYLVALPPRGAPEVFGYDQGIHSGGPLLVDREGSLWVGSFLGLHQLPEPDTRTWGEADGLPSRHARALAAAGTSVWVATWEGTTVLRSSPGGTVVGPDTLDTRSLLCSSGDRGWTIVSDRVVALGEIEPLPTFDAPGAVATGCTVGPDGVVWMGTAGGVLRVEPGGGTQSLPRPPGAQPHELWRAILHDSQDRLFVGAHGRICHIPAAALVAGAADAWSCHPVEPLSHVTQAVEVAPGRVWVASDHAGILEFGNGAWRPVSLDHLPTRSVFALVPSPRGGIWLAGHGFLERILPMNESGWDVVERLSSWHGLHSIGAADLVEHRDGSIWLASARGVTRIPGEARLQDASPPPVTLVEVRSDGQPLPRDGPIRLPHVRNRLDVRFAALSFRDPARVLHQVRVRPEDPWLQSVGDPSFSWVGLGPGRYRVEYRASLDGERWSYLEEPLRFEVLPPWYRSAPALAALLALALLLGWAIHRARLAHLLSMERQRTRIAMDLHDEVGAGLASVGILSGILAQDGLREGERRRTASEITQAAQELGRSLSDIVWSLDPRTATMDELAARLAEHGERLCSEGRSTFTSRLQGDWPPSPLPAPVRRNVFLVGLEALHNAGRHADATTVEFSLGPGEGAHWVLSVEDDGRGFDAGAAPAPVGSGRGLTSMARRAAEIGAHLRVRSRPGRGTAVTLHFQPAPTGLPRWIGMFRRRRLPPVDPGDVS